MSTSVAVSTGGIVPDSVESGAVACTRVLMAQAVRRAIDAHGLKHEYVAAGLGHKDGQRLSRLLAGKERFTEDEMAALPTAVIKSLITAAAKHYGLWCGEPIADVEVAKTIALGLFRFAAQEFRPTQEVR